MNFMNFIKFSFLAACAVRLAVAAPETTPGLDLHWVEGGKPVVLPGNTWGVPWPQGTVPKSSTFTLTKSTGESVPVQSWPLATWPDGSLKWSAHAVGADVSPTETYHLAPGVSASVSKPLTLTEEKGTILIDTGLLQCRLPTKGDVLIESLIRDGKLAATNGRLVCLRRDKAEPDENGSWKQESLTGEISSVKIEQRGPVLAVVKIEGTHVTASGRRLIPFVVRLYFYAGGDSIRVMHTMIYDGDENKDFLSGIGLRFNVPMKGELYDRHVRFSGEDKGLWGEAVRGLTGLRRDPGATVRSSQVAGTAVPVDVLHGAGARIGSHLDFIPAFGDFTLVQPNSDSFVIRKRTAPGYVWLDSATGHRSSGLGYLGSPTGGVAFGIRNFWQSNPGQLDIRNAATDNAEVTLWLWSPEARPMDMRFYHDEMGLNTYAKQLQALDVTYEDYEPGYSTPKGVARTSELMLWALPSTPSRSHLVEMAETLSTPPQLACKPEDYKRAEVFGGAIWGLPDRSNPVAVGIEDQLVFFFDFYKKEVDQRRWYGFWHYGDVMHTYDKDRHVWRYDVGGFAWDNSELSTDLWLWYNYLRSGRADNFRMAEAMTRHTGEVSVYHLGKFAGIGTRHGVVPWGDSAKQLRISTAENRRFYYYLTGDERIGDLLWEEVEADRKLAEVSPRRKLTKESDPTAVSVSVGTDWGAVSAALLTAWERTGEAKYKDKLLTSMRSIAALPHGWLSGGGAYNPETGKFTKESEMIDVSHLNSVFGAFEVNAELIQLLDVPEYEKSWLQYCELYNASPEEQIKQLGQPLKKVSLMQAHSRLTAYAAWKTKSSVLAARSWKEFFSGSDGYKLLSKPFPLLHIEGPDVLEPVDEADVTSNETAQFGLAAIECLSLVGKDLPFVEKK